MPQIAKGGKFIFGWSTIAPDGRVKIPELTWCEYRLAECPTLILFSGSKASGGFCVSNHLLLQQSIMKELFTDHPGLLDGTIPDGECVRFKGRFYCRVETESAVVLHLPESVRTCFDIKPGDRLLSIRGSNIAFVMAVKGPLAEAARQYAGVIEEY